MVHKPQTEENKMKKTTAIISTLLIFISLLLTGCASKISSEGDQTTNQEIQKNDNEKQPVQTEIKDNSSEIIMTDKKPVQEQTQDKIDTLLADGTYTDLVMYKYHSGEEKVNITLTIENDVITSASVVGINPHRTSKSYQEGLNAALPNLVVGKRIDQLDIPKQVSGGSLTTAAFKNHVKGLIEQ